MVTLKRSPKRRPGEERERQFSSAELAQVISGVTAGHHPDESLCETHSPGL
jgi:hypothetical protein